jgi:PelA/Pel-15E family pectate lyase
MRRRRRSFALSVLACGTVVIACRATHPDGPRPGLEPVAAGTAAPGDGGTRLGKGPVDGNAADFFAEARLAALPPEEQASWRDYLAASERLGAADRAELEAELRALHRAAMTRAPFQKAFRLDPQASDEWFRGADGVRIADNLLSFQTPSGGWSKHVDYAVAPRAPGQSYYSETDTWQYVATIDNDSTTEQLRFLARAWRARGEARYRDAFLRGTEYLLGAQFPNGCWPQVFPLEGGYHDAATYNDNAIVNVLGLLGDIAAGRFDFVSGATRERAGTSVERGTSCIVKSQFSAGGALTIWAQQVHPLTLEPVSARSYELAALSGRESVGVVAYLMSLPAPDERVVRAVDAAIAWFKAHEIFGYEYEHYALTAAPGAGPLWARLYEIGTDRPIFSNRDGVKRYDWNELTDRRRGYVWFTKEPNDVLTAYEAWSHAHRRAGAEARARDAGLGLP